MKKLFSLPAGLVLTLCLAAAITLMWPSASVSTTCGIQTIRTAAAAAQQAQCSSNRVCEEWVMVCAGQQPQEMDVFCCSDGNTCKLFDTGLPF